MKPIHVFLVSAASAFAASLVVSLAIPAAMGKGESGSSPDASALRSQIDDLHKEVTQLRKLVESSQTATAAAVQAPTRKEVEMPSSAAAAKEEDPAAKVAAVDREAILAVLDQRDKDKDRERKEKQRQQLRDGVESRVKQSADRLGFDANTTQSVTKLYLDNLGREEEIHRAYPVTSIDDPNNEKSRLEIDAARNSLDTALQSIIPSDKWNDWNNQTRFLRRAGDFAYNADQQAAGNINMFGGFGGFGGPGGGGPGGPGGNGGQGGRGNRGGGAGGGFAGGGQTATIGVGGGGAPAPPATGGATGKQP
jgi:hypothetical protein